MARQKFDFHSGFTPQQNTISHGANVSSTTPSGEVGSPEERKSLLDAYKIIPRNKIRFNKKNDYPLDEIEKLKDLLLHYGMLQDILVVYSIEEDMYIIEAGHRRTTALDALIEQFKNWAGPSDDSDYLLYKQNISCYERGYVCKVIDRLKENIDYDAADENLDVSVIDSEIRLIITNEGAREISPPVRAKNIQRLARLLELRNQGKDKPVRININATIAEQMNITERQVINYKNTEKLIPELKELFDQEKLSLKLANAYSSLDADAQHEIYLLIKNGTEVNLDQVRTLKQETSRLKSELEEKEQELLSIRDNSSGEPGSPDTTSIKTICNLLSNNIIASIKELNSNMDFLVSQDPDASSWIESQKNKLRELL